MQSTQNCRLCCNRNQYVIIFVFLLISSMTHLRFLVDAGRSITNQLVEPNQRIDHVEDGDEKWMGRSLIGSRPPRCERMCRSCGHCEAVQVPIVPASAGMKSRHYRTRSADHGYYFRATPNLAYSRGDDISNYKPMCWKCKCGNFIFDP